MTVHFQSGKFDSLEKICKMDSKDSLAHSSAMIQYKIRAHNRFEFACKQHHVCFDLGQSGLRRGGTDRSKRMRTDVLLCETTTNAKIALEHTGDSGAVLKVAGICAAEPALSTSDMRNAPNMARRTTVQASGIASLLVPGELHKSIVIGTYVGVSTTNATVDETDFYSVFEIVPVDALFKADLVIGRVCNINSLVTGITELSILLTLQIRPPPHILPDTVTRSEEALFNAYIPPALLHDIWAYITPGAADERASDKREEESIAIFKKAAAQAREQNMSLVASTLENAVFEKQKNASYATDFPGLEEMSAVGLHAFLVGNLYTKGVLWFFESLDETRTSIPLIMRHRPEDDLSAGGMASASMFKTDAEMKAMQSFLSWSKEHADHVQEPSFANVIENLTSTNIRPNSHP